MKRTVEYAVLALVITALAAYLWLRPADRSHYRVLALEPIDPAAIERVVITRDKQTAALEKHEGKWRLVPGDYPADGDKAKTIIDTAARLSLTALVSEAKDYARYDLVAPKRIGVEVVVGNQVKRRFDIGKAAPSFRHTFVKVEGDERVWHALENFRRHFDQSADDLRDKNVLTIDEKTVARIEVVKGQTTVVLRAEKPPVENAAAGQSQPAPPVPVWQRQDGAAVDQARIRRLVTTLSRLRCASFVYDRAKADFTDPLCTVRIDNGSRHELALFAPADGQDAAHPAVSSQNPYAFLLSPYDAKTILEATDPPAPAAASPAEAVPPAAQPR